MQQTTAFVTTQPVTLVTAQPIGINPFQQYHNEWSAGLCDCCDDMSTCCYAWFCGPCFMYSFTEKIDESCITAYCVPNAPAIYRMKIRSMYRIRGSSCKDYLTTSCCGFFATLQMANELKAHGIEL